MARSRPRQRNQSPVDARTRFERAAALEPTDPQAALVAYRSIAKGKGAWAGNALFAAGRLAAELGDPSAKSLLEAYLERFPKGANAADAKRLLRELP